MTTTKAVSLTIRREQADYLLALSSELGVSRSLMVREALDIGLPQTVRNIKARRQPFILPTTTTTNS